MQHVMLVYDVPSITKIDPTKVLRRLGTRVNLSCWILPETNIPWDYLNEIKEHKVVWHTVRFDLGEADKIRELARQNLLSEIGAIKNSMFKTIERSKEAYARMEEAMKMDSDIVLDRQLGAAINRAKKLLRDSSEAALAFGVTTDVDEISNAVQAAIASEIEARIAFRRIKGIGRQVPVFV